MSASSPPDLAGLLQDLGLVPGLAPTAIPTLLGELERLRATLWARIMSANLHPNARPDGDSLLTVEQAARQLSVSRDWLYRRAAKLPFTVRLGPRQLRFSLQGIERFIRQRQGR